MPKQFVELHEQIIAMRDQILVHSDADPSISLGGLAGNNVRIFIGDGRFDVAAYEMKPRGSRIAEIRQLAAALNQSTHAELTKLINDHTSELPSVEGEFAIDLKEQKFIAVEPVRDR